MDQGASDLQMRDMCLQARLRGWGDFIGDAFSCERGERVWEREPFSFLLIWWKRSPVSDLSITWNKLPARSQKKLCQKEMGKLSKYISSNVVASPGGFFFSCLPGRSLYICKSARLKLLGERLFSPTFWDLQLAKCVISPLLPIPPILH